MEPVLNARGVGKVSFDHIYNQSDPRAYFRAMAELHYQPPQHGLSVFQKCLDALERDQRLTHASVLDLCCGYGVNAALLRHDVTLGDLYARYASIADDTTPEALRQSDRAYFAARRRRNLNIRTIGIDTASNAIAYACDVGLLDYGMAVDLETNTPDWSAGPQLDDVALISVTGGVGYIGAATFGNLLRRIRGGRPPWVVCLVLRFIPFDPCADVLANYGLVTEKWTQESFPQRRFANLEEQRFVLSELSRLGIDPRDREEQGFLHTDLFISRPAEDLDRIPLQELVRKTRVTASAGF